MDSCLRRNDNALKDRNKLCFAIKDFNIQAGGLYIFHNPGKHFVGVAVVIADNTDPDGGDLPFIAVFDFSNRDMKFIADAGNDGLNYHSFTLESFILGDAQVNFTNTDIHRFQ